MLLTEILSKKGIRPPNATPEGMAWLAKTLHPADNAPPWAGIPNGSGLPSVVMEYEALLRVSPNAAAVGTWSGYFNLLPHPSQPFSGTTTDSVGDLTWGLRNPTLYSSGDTMSAVSEKLRVLAGAYRLTHCAVTIDLDAPALSNQGSVTAAQYPLQWLDFNPSYVLAAGADATKLFCAPHIRGMEYTVNQLNREQLAAKPFSYSGLAKDNLYMVLKMDPDVEWGRTSDVCLHTAIGPNMGPYPGVALPKTAGALGTNETFPWYGGNLPAADRFIYSYINAGTALAGPGGDLIPKIMQPNFGRIAFWNLAVAAGLTCRVRWGVEYLVPPTSALAPSVRVCAPRDDACLTAYSKIVDELPDAFPGSYNSWDELGSVLRSVWKGISPALGVASLAPKVGPVAGGIKMVGDMIAQSTRSEKADKSRPAAVVNQPQRMAITVAPQDLKKAARKIAKASKKR